MSIGIEDDLAASTKGILVNCFWEEYERGNVLENLV